MWCVPISCWFARICLIVKVIWGFDVLIRSKYQLVASVVVFRKSDLKEIDFRTYIP